MSGKQLLIIVILSSLTFLLIAGAGGYVYYTQPELLGTTNPYIKRDTTQKPDPLKLEAERLQRTTDSLAKAMAAASDSLSRSVQRADELAMELKRFHESEEAAKKQRLSNEAKAERDSIRLKKMRSFAEMYDKADPAEVANILKESDSNYAAQVLQMMKRKNAAKVIEKLPPAKAVAIAKAGTD
ncbi:MAG: hypothetical protein JNL32_00775 [Candidatus Kapabacteria bacterium]|nr:hypothetical protein [Candidatus Kapabacteria bacterium]